jgi:hypothetical protein
VRVLGAGELRDAGIALRLRSRKDEKVDIAREEELTSTCSPRSSTMASRKQNV